LERALEGSFTDNQRWLLGREVCQLEWLEGQIEAMEKEIELRMLAFAEPMQRVMTIPGIDRKTAWMILAELGPDLTAFPDAKHLASWAGLCPGNNESGGRRMSGRTRKANCYVKRGMCQAAWAASHSKDTYLSSFYRRIQFRKGARKAIMALAHHMITVVYNVLVRREEYVELGSDFYEQRNKPRVVSRLVARLAKLGYEVHITPAERVGVAEPLPDVAPQVEHINPLPVRSDPLNDEAGRVSVPSAGSLASTAGYLMLSRCMVRVFPSEIFVGKRIPACPSSSRSSRFQGGRILHEPNDNAHSQGQPLACCRRLDLRVQNARSFSLAASSSSEWPRTAGLAPI
jgi:hypothetical protein